MLRVMLCLFTVVLFQLFQPFFVCAVVAAEDLSGAFQVRHIAGKINYSAFLPSLISKGGEGGDISGDHIIEAIGTDVFNVAPSPLKMIPVYSTTMIVSSKPSDFYNMLEVTKKAVNETTVTYTPYIFAPIREYMLPSGGQIQGVYTPKDYAESIKKQEAKTFYRMLTTINTNGTDIHELKEGVVGNCKVFFRVSTSFLRMGPFQKSSDVYLTFQTAIPENSKCEADIKKEGDRIVGEFIGYLKKVAAASSKEIKPADSEKTSAGGVSLAPTARGIETALTVNCAAGNILACPASLALSVVNFFTDIAKNAEVQETIEIRNKEELDIRDKCLEVMKDKSAAIISLEGNMRLECIKGYGLVKAKFFKDNTLIKYVIRMEPDGKVSQTQ